uniref:Uncharacterized protein n=1 Tax=viral metagenome TaxID=1070528 RepID=A0A6C0BSX2_9ZZZZ
MKYILYYSNNCNSSKNVLYSLSRNYNAKDICYICIDKRVKNQDGTRSVVLDNGQLVPLPPNITHVPSLMLLNRGFNLIQGDEPILGELLPRAQNTVSSLGGFVNSEPLAFSYSEMNGMSDNYSYLSLDANQMSTQGNGGLAMMHTFAHIDQVDSIETPPDSQDRGSGPVDLERIKQERNSQVQIPRR